MLCLQYYLCDIVFQFYVNKYYVKIEKYMTTIYQVNNVFQ